MNGARRVGLAAGGRRVLHVHGSTIIQYIASVSTVPMGKTKLLVRGALHRAGRARWLEPTEAGPGLARCARGLSYRPARREPGVPAASSPRRVRYRQHCRPGRSLGAPCTALVGRAGSNLPKLGRASHDAPGASATGQPAENPVYRRHLARGGCATGSTAAQGAA